jgi:hypothetical protein
LKFTFQSVSVEQVKKPGQKAPYGKATVFYTYNGEPRKQTIVSIFNPGIFKQVNELEQGTEIEVEVIKNEAGFNEWKSLTVGGATASGNASVGTPAAAGTPTKVVGSNYETRDERAARQVLIVKQSSLSSAVASLTPGATEPLDVDMVMERAQMFSDWVFDNNVEEVE